MDNTSLSFSVELTGVFPIPFTFSPWSRVVSTVSILYGSPSSSNIPIHQKEEKGRKARGNKKEKQETTGKEYYVCLIVAYNFNFLSVSTTLYSFRVVNLQHNDDGKIPHAVTSSVLRPSAPINVNSIRSC